MYRYNKMASNQQNLKVSDEHARERRMKFDVLNAMEEYLIDMRLWDDFVEGFMEGLEGAEKEEYKKHFGL